MDLTIKLV